MLSTSGESFPLLADGKTSGNRGQNRLAVTLSWHAGAIMDWLRDVHDIRLKVQLGSYL